MPSHVIAVVGPTATGKSALALHLAERLGGEIVNADSMQFYRGMDIGTAKTPHRDRAGIPHHLLDTLDVTQEASVADYQHQARTVIEQVATRGMQPILAGGSGLYLRAALDRIEFPATDPAVRSKWEQRAEQVGPGLLHAELAARDPAAADRIGPANTRRLVRALEVIELTGKPFTASLPDYTYLRPTRQVGLRVPREVLNQRIEARARAMMASGLLAETEQLRRVGLERGVTARRAVGYAQALDVLDGRLSEDEAVAAITVATRQLARRQEKWFQRDPRIVWLDGEAPLAEQAKHAHRAVTGSLEE